MTSVPFGNMTFDRWAQLATLVGTLLVGGMKFGAMDSRVGALEARKDQTEDVATVRQQVSDLTSDMHDVRQDVRDIKRILTGTARR